MTAEQRLTQSPEMSRKLSEVTIGFSVTDNAAFEAVGNPFHLKIPGLHVHTISAFDAHERAENYRAELERLVDVVSAEDADRINLVLGHSLPPPTPKA